MNHVIECFSMTLSVKNIFNADDSISQRLMIKEQKFDFGCLKDRTAPSLTDQSVRKSACHRSKRVFSGVDLPAENNPRNDGIRTKRNKGRNLHSLRSGIVYARSVSANCVIG
ncbi:hypothetical protein TNCV_3535101 [Trichonephila clavipes]|nr:hypothetical protein TNCV_3535101 [Trichonephila clavipes]